MTFSKTFCKAPNIWRVISPQGDLKPCCAFRGSIGHLNTPPPPPPPHTHTTTHTALNKLNQDLLNGIKNKGCQECWHRESLGFSSHRLYGDDWEKLENKLIFIEFNFSNLCHLKCLMCNGDSSSSWIKDELEIRKDVHLKFRYPHSTCLSHAFPTRGQLIRFLDSEDLSQIQRLTFKGGEPLLHNQVFETTEYFQKKNLKDLQIQFTSSGTILNKNLKNLFDFREVEFTFSVEGVGLLYNYIRGGKKYGLTDVIHLINFLEKISNYRIISNSCISAYSFFGISDLYIWLKKHIPHNKAGFVKDHFVSLDYPEYMGAKAIPLSVRERAASKNISILKKNDEWTSELEDQIVSLLSLSIPHDEKLLQQFVLFTKKIDKMRKQSIVETIPEYKELFYGENEIEK